MKQLILKAAMLVCFFGGIAICSAICWVKEKLNKV